MPTAEQLAADVKRWLADEPVAVYREPLGQRLARWLRRHRTLAGVAGVVVLVVVPLTIGFSLLVAAKNQELSQTNRDLESALAREEDQRRQAEQARQVAEQRRAEAEEARQLADLRRQQAERAADRARSVIELVASDEAFDQLSRKKELTAEEKKLLEALVPYYEEYARESGSGQAEQERQARAYFRLSRTLHLLGRHEPAEKAYRQALHCASNWWPSIPRCPSTASNWP
jgi:tetratricopeptide (TPR) repeat protein